MSAILNTYNRKKVAFTKGKGAFLYGTNGKKYLDFVQGIAVNCLGHANNYLINSISKQVKKLWHVSNAFVIPEQERLAKRLKQKTFADYVFFQNSGAEATEAAIKFARRYFYSKGQPRKNRILCINNSFHGRTLATIFASNSKKAIEGFGPKVDGFDHFNFGDHKSLEKSITSRTAAIMVETIMGEGGIKVIPDYCLVGLRKLCNKKKILLILDEVQCGIGRSGKFFAFEHAKIKPDIVPIAKGIGGGFPLGACLMNKKTASSMTPGSHGSTFGGNPLAMSIATVVLDYILNKDFLKNVIKVGNYLKSRLDEEVIKKYPTLVSGIRGKGLMLGIESKIKNEILIKEMINHKLLTVKASQNIIRILPPLILEEKHVDEAILKINKAFKNL